MTVYADLLRARVDDEEYPCGAVTDLLAGVLAARVRLGVSEATDAAGRLAAALAYDAAILRLCRALDVPTDIGGDGPPERARAEAEAALSAALPSLCLETF
ncbi:MAG TPA: hypothetical protein VFP54_04460 [Acidimicrobiales bacterium]|nr:hypothetical protein [Acidimicrobiales bacterium]